MSSTACRGDASDAVTERDRADGRALSEVLGADGTPRSLEEVDEAVDLERPERAARLLREGALPAARAFDQRLRSWRPATERGRVLQHRAIETSAARIDALTAYASALARGVVEDQALLDAIRRQRDVEAGWATIHEEVEALVRPGTTPR